MNKEVTSFIESANPKHQEILKELRKLILSVAPQSEEQYKCGVVLYMDWKKIFVISNPPKNT